MSGITLVLLFSGYFLWIIFYVLTIRRSYLDKICGAPMIGICLGISWEFMFSFIEPQLPVMSLCNKLWFFCDSIILIEFLAYNKSEFPSKLPSAWFYPTTIASLLLSFALVVCFTYQFQDLTGRISGFFMLLPMSIWFNTMLIGRGHLGGQSLYAAIAKLLGTLSFAVISYQHDPGSKLLNFLYPSILLFDLIYCALIIRTARKLQISPWTRL